MGLTERATIDPYKVGLLGKGGMGEVYRARDTKLDRDVALKVLPEAFTSDPDRLARFEREAKVLASLNHPNIGSIYGLEESEGVKALVLELVEGPTLADRIAQGPIPVDEALPLAKQIAEALEAAHEAGVIHRDLKPANIKVRDDGTVKVLDFVLAKALAGETPDVDLSQSPTVTATVGGTREGVILGTTAYMSPEQARGKPLDKRTDIWSFGCVLFEMLTGRAAFSGETLSDTLAAVLEREPGWDQVPAGVPPDVMNYLRRSVERLAQQRVRDIGDFRLALEGAFAARLAIATPKGKAPATGRTMMAVVLLALVVGAAGGGIVLSVLGRSEPVASPVTRYAVTTDARDAGSLGGVVVSPDGGLLVYVRGDGNDGQLFVRRRDQLASRVLV